MAPHHGSRTSSTPDFVHAVSPRFAVFTVGHRNRFGHPREDVVARYRQKGSLLLRTDRLGALRVVLRDESAVTSAYRQEARRYWRSRQKAPFTDPDMDGKEAWGHVLYDLSQGRVDPFYFERTFGRASLLAQSLI